LSLKKNLKKLCQKKLIDTDTSAEFSKKLLPDSERRWATMAKKKKAAKKKTAKKKKAAPKRKKKAAKRKKR